MFSRELWAVTRLDLAEVLRSRWMFFTTLVYGAIAATFVLVGLHESSVLGFTGLGRVLLSMVHTLLILLPLLALTATGQVINRARDDGSLEFLFSQPIRREVYFCAVSLSRYLVLLLPLIVLMVALAALGALIFETAVPWSFLLQTLAICAALLATFVATGLAISTWIRNQARAVIGLLLVWALGVALLDFALVGAMLRWRLNPEAVFLLASLNPVQCARMALLAGTSQELSVLGPVGFYLTHTVGPWRLFALGLAWPLTLGGLLWGGALRHFRTSDLV